MKVSEYVEKANSKMYVFNKHEAISLEAFQLLDAFIQMVFPKYFSAPHLLGPESIHFYLGQVVHS
jgi:hypothetical protein